MASAEPVRSRTTTGSVGTAEALPEDADRPGAPTVLGPAGDDPVIVTRRGLGRRFWLLWWATGISASGDGLVFVALSLLAFTFTHNALAIAGVAATFRGSMALAAVPAGVVVDRFERRDVMLVANIVPGLALFGLVALITVGRADLVMVYVAASALATCDVTYALAMQSVFSDVISSPDRLATANARLMGVDVAGENLVGQAGGGLLFAVSRRLPFFADSISFFVSAVLVRASVPRAKRPLLHAGGAARRPPTAATGPALIDGQLRHGGGWLADLRTGLRVFRRHRVLKLIAATIGLTNFSQGPVLAMMVIYGERGLHLRPTGYGIFLAAASVLGIAAMFSGGAVIRGLGGARTMVLGSLLASASYIGLAFVHQVVVATVVFGLQEMGVAILNVASLTTRQRLIPRQVYGRVAGIIRFLLTIVWPVGAVIGGFVAAQTSVRGAFFAMGVVEAAGLVYLGPALIRAVSAAERELPS